MGRFGLGIELQTELKKAGSFAHGPGRIIAP